MMEVKEDIRDLTPEFQKAWAELRKYYGENIVLADLQTAARLKYDRWEAQTSRDRTERAEAAKDVMRCEFTFKAFNALKQLKNATEVKKGLFFAEYQHDHLVTFGQLMGDIPRTLLKQGEWWLAEKKEN